MAPFLVIHGRRPLTFLILRFAIHEHSPDPGYELSISFCQILGWSVLVRVDGVTYSFLGAVQQPTINATVDITNFTVTPTRTIVTGKAGPMQVSLTFLNPIEVRFHSYVTFDVFIRITLSPKIGLSNPPHSHTWLSPRTHQTAQVTLCRCIQMSARVRPIVLRSPSFLFSFLLEWNSGDRNQTILWGGPPTNSDVVFHSVQLQVQVPFMEIIDQAEWGFLYYATLAVS